MKLFFDFLPIIIFFIFFKFYGIYIATAAAIAISILQVGTYWFRYRKIPTLQWISLGLITLLGGSTLLLHDEMFIKWKPTALNWALALIFLGSQLWGEKPFIQRLMENAIVLPRKIWLTLSTSWVIFFILMGTLNLVVAYRYTTNTWVNFKLFGILGLTLLFAILQALYLSHYIELNQEERDKVK